MIYDAAGHYVGFHYNKWPLSSNILRRMMMMMMKMIIIMIKRRMRILRRIFMGEFD